MQCTVLREVWRQLKQEGVTNRSYEAIRVLCKQNNCGTKAEDGCIYLTPEQVQSLRQLCVAQKQIGKGFRQNAVAKFHVLTAIKGLPQITGEQLIALCEAHKALSESTLRRRGVKVDSEFDPGTARNIIIGVST